MIPFPLALPGSRQKRALAILDEVEEELRTRIGSRLFLIPGPWRWTREGMVMIVTEWANRFDEHLRSRAQARRFLANMSPVERLDDEDFERCLSDYLVSISNFPIYSPIITRTWNAKDERGDGGVVGDLSVRVSATVSGAAETGEHYPSAGQRERDLARELQAQLEV